MKAKMLSTLILFSFVLITTSSANESNITPSNIKVMSYNILYSGSDEKVNSENERVLVWSKRKELLFNLINEQNPDIINLQEVTGFLGKSIFWAPRLVHMTERPDGFNADRPTGQLSEVIYEFIDKKYNVVIFRTWENAESHNVILYKRDRFNLVDSYHFWLSENSDEESIGWNAKYPRGVLGAKLKGIKSNQLFFNYNTHLDHVGKVARLNSINLIQKHFKEVTKTYPVIISGDFNAKPKTKPIQEMLNPSFITLKKPHKLIIPTWRIMRDTACEFDDTLCETPTSYKRDKRIDYIFASSNVRVTNSYIIGNETKDTPHGKTFPSDHFGVVSKLKL